MSRPTGILLLSLLPLILAVSGCVSPGSTEEALGRGIVRGTLGAYQAGAVVMAPPEATESVKGYVVFLEGGAYVVEGIDGAGYRIPLDENTRIDRPAHVGDKIEVFLDRGGRALLIHNIDHELTHTVR
jgi:hypothetical protein